MSPYPYLFNILRIELATPKFFKQRWVGDILLNKLAHGSKTQKIVKLAKRQLVTARPRFLYRSQLAQNHNGINLVRVRKNSVSG